MALLLKLVPAQAFHCPRNPSACLLHAADEVSGLLAATNIRHGLSVDPVDGPFSPGKY